MLEVGVPSHRVQEGSALESRHVLRVGGNLSLPHLRAALRIASSPRSRIVPGSSRASAPSPECNTTRDGPSEAARVDLSKWSFDMGGSRHKRRVPPRLLFGVLAAVAIMLYLVFPTTRESDTKHGRRDGSSP